MEIGEFMEVAVLMGYYKNLLSDRQMEYMVKHFEEDYSLSEIAKEYEVSRQAVHDNIKRGIIVLKEYEGLLKFRERDNKIRERLSNLARNYNVDELNAIIEEYY
jgi:predicted DNA-binding protein YlxM (UPF0122 family)